VAHLLSSLGAKVVVAAHPTDSLVTEDAMIIAIMLSAAGLGFLCGLAFILAVYALPFLAGTAAGIFAYHTGAGAVGGVSVGLIAGAITLLTGEFAFANIRSRIIRSIIAATFALPAAVAGYHLILGLSALGMPSETWCQLVAITGAVVVGSTAWGCLLRSDQQIRGANSVANPIPQPTTPH
jgi:hypothetical protein